MRFQYQAVNRWENFGIEKLWVLEFPLVKTSKSYKTMMENFLIIEFLAVIIFQTHSLV